MIKVSIIGASGYAGGELLRILADHPEFKVGAATSRKYEGRPVSDAHPNLRGKIDLKFSSIEDLEKCDLLFVSLPNGKSMEKMDGFTKLAGKVVDLGADFRLREKEEFEKWYDLKHKNTKLLQKFTYGLSEIRREDIKKADYVACGGCEATAIILALYPLIKEGIIEKENIIADVKIGSSAAGSKSNLSTHHPERHGVLRSYQPTSHRHEAEVRQEIDADIAMSATAVNIVRGVLATIHTQIKEGLEEKDVWKAYRKVYKDEPFVRIVKQRHGLYRYPEPKILWGTNYCDIGFEKEEGSDRLVVLSAVDNLVKGTAGQAVQAANIMFGFDETLGLEFAGLHPV